MHPSATIEPAILRQLSSVAAKLTADSELKKDLVQEMAIHWGRVQTELPGRTKSWYIKSCEFHARNHLKRGRSVDSRKRAHNLVSFDLLTDESTEIGFFSGAPTDNRPALIAEDLIELITPKLSDRQNKVLRLLLDGCGVREAGRRLGISHPAVIKHRNRIAIIARRIIADNVPSRSLPVAGTE
jgi:RNA polymerase sigma factor (sigma-70 family)